MRKQIMKAMKHHQLIDIIYMVKDSIKAGYTKGTGHWMNSRVWECPNRSTA